MKPLTRRGFTAAGILAALGLTGCALFNSCTNRPESVYGPPPTNYDPNNNEPIDVYGPPGDYDPKNDEIETLYGPPDDFEPDDNIEETVYGPPDDWDLEPVEPADPNKDIFNPSNNEIEDVYGPPEDFEPDINEIEGVYGPPDDLEQRVVNNMYEAERNIPPAVYGPPSMFR